MSSKWYWLSRGQRWPRRRPRAWSSLETAAGHHRQGRLRAAAGGFRAGHPSECSSAPRRPASSAAGVGSAVHDAGIAGRRACCQRARGRDHGTAHLPLNELDTTRWDADRVEAQIVTGEHMHLIRAVYEPGAIYEMHSHSHEQFSLLLSGRMLLTGGRRDPRDRAGRRLVRAGRRAPWRQGSRRRASGLHRRLFAGDHLDPRRVRPRPACRAGPGSACWVTRRLTDNQWAKV